MDAAVSRSTFVGNSGSEEGGAIFAGYEIGLNLVNDTFEGNRATHGGALVLASSTKGSPGNQALASSEEGSPAEQVLLNDTIVRNESEDGGALAPFEGPAFPYLKIENTIVALNAGGDCSGTAPTDRTGSADEGGNIDSDGSCFSEEATGDHTGVPEPALGVAELASNGGPTETDALIAASPAIGGGLPGTCPGTDARNISRVGRPCDSGAYQSAAPTSEAPSGSPPPTGAPETAKAAGRNQPCRSVRVEPINWRVPRGVHLTRVTVTLDGHIYRRLAGDAHSVRVRLVGLPRGAVTVRVRGTAGSHVSYGTTRVYHPCIPEIPSVRQISVYLRRR
jgi:hypothetical protein